MAVAAILLVSEPKSEIFLDIFRKANTNQLAIGMPPHISLAVFNDIDTTQLDQAVQRFSQAISPLDVYMSSIAMFPNERPVVYALPVINSTLLDIHQRFHNCLGDLTDKCWDYYKPDKWSPHLTLGTTDCLTSALEIMSTAYNVKLCGNYLLNQISLIEFYPVKVISTYDLGN